MKALPMVGGVLVWCLCSPPAAADPAKQPPMNSFNFAFYTCDGGDAFQVAYDSDTPRTATLTTNTGSRPYVLARTSDDTVQFAKGAVRFQPSGRTAQIEGVKATLKGCKLKGN